ncbi:MAG: hypothetical protein ACYDCK_06895 [Thermoplasmatota archaeon]
MARPEQPSSPPTSSRFDPAPRLELLLLVALLTSLAALAALFAATRGHLMLAWLGLVLAALLLVALFSEFARFLKRARARRNAYAGAPRRAP